ncbi:hypothetical protein RJT34_30561 [Clitoria ternatea]|uniref:Nitrate regulatory gene2 protein-like n=1 Tax=Clitoria ternatea TaxID=43366 RepID=A0AAN9ETL4_CLITE
MGCSCSVSKIEREETLVSRCKARKRCMKQLVQARHDFSMAHAFYIRSLSTTASALVRFAYTQQQQQHQAPIYHHHFLPSQPQQPPPWSLSMSTPYSNTWTSPLSASPVPPTPPPPATFSWKSWDPFGSFPSPEEYWKEATTISKEVSKINNDNKVLIEIMNEMQGYFLKAADAGARVSALLQVNGRSERPSLWLCVSVSVAKFEGPGRASGGHCSTLERLYTLEKKLWQQVKNVEATKMEQQKKRAQLERADHEKMEKINKDVDKLKSQEMIISHAMETTNAEIIKLRETQLYPQLVELVKGLMCMWRSMNECHQAQKNIVLQLGYLKTIPSTESTSEIHRQSTLQLEIEVKTWHQSFCKLFNAHRNYIQSLTRWLRLSLSQFNRKPLNNTAEQEETRILYRLCEAWNHAFERIPYKVESEAIKSFLTSIHAIVVQQREEHKQKKKLDAAVKELEKKVVQLGSLRSKHGPHSMVESSDAMKTKDLVTKMRTKVEHSRAKAEEEKTKHEMSIRTTGTVTLNNLQIGFQQVFQGIVRISSVCIEVFESVYYKARIPDLEDDVRRVVP